MNKKYLNIFLIAVGVAFLSGFIISLNFNKINLVTVLMKAMPQRQFTTNTNILLVGIDNSVDGTRRADTLMIANINPYTKYIGIISVPRDTRLPIDGHELDKINSAYAYGGIKLLRKSLSNYLQIPIPYYIEIDLQGVINIIDQLGGIEMDVEKRMHYVDHAGDLYIDLQPGRQLLDGKRAMQYVRFRHDETGDLGRIKRQQKFMSVLGKKMADVGVVFRVPRLIHQFSKHVRSNLSSGEVISLSMKMREAYELGHLDIATLPGADATIDSISFLIPDWNLSQNLVTRVIKGYEFVANPYPDLKKPPELIVQVLNGNGIARMGNNAARKLKAFGYRVKSIGDAGRSNYKNTILVNWHGQSTEDESYILARKLYIDPTNIVQLNYPKKSADFTLVLGHDWPIER